MSDDADTNTHKYITLFQYIQNLPMRVVRDMYKGIRQSGDGDPDMFFPQVGITAGEFSVAQVNRVPRRTRA
jgi:hypothetical protein